MNERDFAQAVLKRIDPHFHIKTEVWGTHFSGNRKRVDAIIWPKDRSEWKRADIAFGIEFKRPDAFMDIADVSGMIRQAYDYIYTDFDGFGKVPLLVCPLKIQDHYTNESEMKFVRRILGKFGIGEIKNTHMGVSIYFQDSHCVWTERCGISCGRTWAFNFG